MFRAIRFLLCFIVVAGAGVPARALQQNEQPAPVLVVEKLHRALLDSMNQGAGRNFGGRREAIGSVVREVFDLETMTRVSVGGGWQSLSDGERKSLVDIFAEWTAATYASQFKSWDGERFVVTGFTDPEKTSVLVNTEIRPRSGKATALDYRLRLRPGEERWYVIDILLDGAVSQLALRRSDFAGVFSKGGAAALASHLQALTRKLETGG